MPLLFFDGEARVTAVPSQVDLCGAKVAIMPYHTCKGEGFTDSG